MHFAVIYGSVRRHRQGIHVARWVVDRLQSRGHQVSLVDPRETGLPLLDLMYKEFEPDQAPENMRSLAQLLRRVDGFIVVSGEYNHGIPPALKNLLDHFQREFFWRPAALVTYSAQHTGGVRVVAPLRATLGELGMVTMGSTVDVPSVGDAFDEQGHVQSSHLKRGKDRFFEEFEWYAKALAKARESGVPYGDPNAS